MPVLGPEERDTWLVRNDRSVVISVMYFVPTANISPGLERSSLGHQGTSVIRSSVSSREANAKARLPSDICPWTNNRGLGRDMLAVEICLSASACAKKTPAQRSTPVRSIVLGTMPAAYTGEPQTPFPTSYPYPDPDADHSSPSSLSGASPVSAGFAVKVDAVKRKPVPPAAAYVQRHPSNSVSSVGDAAGPGADHYRHTPVSQDYSYSPTSTGGAFDL